MTEMEQAPQPFKMETQVIPPGVELEHAIERNSIIAAYREDSIDALTAHEALLTLYWHTQKITNGETNVYLMESAYQFPVEAGMPFEEAEEIYMNLVNSLPITYVRPF